MANKEKEPRKAFVNGCLASYHNPFSNIAEQYREIRNNIGFAAGGPCRSIAVTSPSDGDGKSTAAVNLAISLTQRGERVLIIDANIRKPMLHYLFEAPLSPGMTEVLVGHSVPSDAIQPTGIENLSLLPGGALLHGATDMTDSQAMNRLLEQAGESFDVLVMDCPSILESSDACSLASKCDGVVLMVSGGRTQRKKALQSKKALDFGKAKLLGVVLNRNKKYAF